MRIDLNAGIAETADQQRSATSASSVVSGKSGAEGIVGRDTASFSQDQGRVQELAFRANQFPEIRQEKVAALQRAIQEGSYQVTPGQAAEALISAMQNRSAA
jgi:flagellar biosynthesis anti-sigma factor FlgM